MVSAGSGAAKSIASSLLKVLRGSTRWMTMRPVLSSASIPPMPPCFVFANRSAPTMSLKSGVAGEFIAIIRSIVAPKSEARTGVPSE